MLARPCKLLAVVLGSILVTILGIILWAVNWKGLKELLPDSVASSRSLSLINKKVLLYAERPEGFGWSPDETRIVVAQGLSILLYDLQTPGEGKLIYQMQTYGPYAEDVRISSISWGSKNVLAVSSVFDVECDVGLITLSGVEVSEWREERCSPQWLADGQRLVYAGIGGVYLWDTQTGSEEKLFDNGDDYALLGEDQVVFSIMGREPGLPSAEPGLVLYNWRAQRLLQLTKGEADRFPTVARNEYVIFVRGGFFAWEPKQTLWFVHIPTGEQGHLLSEECFKPAVSPSGRYLLCWTKAAEQDKYALTLFDLELERQKPTQ